VIHPLTNDATWRGWLVNLPILSPIVGSLTVIAPHPDDETLGAGALIATLRKQNVPVIVVAATDGENAYDTGSSERAKLGRLREQEQADALATLGVEQSAIKRLGMIDSCLSDHEAELTDKLLAIVEPETTLLAPWTGDFHPDHEACARAAATVAKAKSLPLISYFFWTWHRGEPALLDGLPLYRFQPEPQALVAKARALAMHHSQLYRPSGDPILPDTLLGPARWPFEIFLQP
jgi:LmbE family N-acetylglucosaminyl deacetylase